MTSPRERPRRPTREPIPVHGLRGSHVSSRDGEEEDQLVGSLFDGNYHILGRLGRGGFGAVYEARDVRLDKRVAIKVLERGSASNEGDLASFKAEARRVTRLDHPNIVDWKVFGETPDGTCYFVMELLEGSELRDVIAREAPLRPRRAAGILFQVADALRAAHRLPDGDSILHLDLKPGNVFLVDGQPGQPGHLGRPAERVKVIDFGIGQYVGGEPPSSWSSSGATDGLGDRTIRTEARAPRAAGPDGLCLSSACTPPYAAPEHCAHLKSAGDVVALDGRADLYSLGAIGYELLTGERPFAGVTDYDELLRVKQRVPAPGVADSGVRVPRRLAAFVDRCLALDREDRFPDADAAWRALHRIVHPPLLPRLAAGFAATLVAAALVVAWLWPDGGRASLEVLAPRDGVLAPVAGRTLHLGPARPSVRLRLRGDGPLARPDALRVVDAADGADLGEAFGLAWLGDETVELVPRMAGARWRGSVVVELDGGDGAERDRLRTAPIDVAWLGDGAPRIASVEVAGRGERALDPVGATLEVRVQGDPAEVALLEASAAGERVVVRRDPRVEADGTAVWTLALDAFPWTDGAHGLAVRLDDVAGGASRAGLGLRVVAGELALEEAVLEGALATGGGFLVAPGDEPVLRARASGPADLSWRVLGADGAELASGRREGGGRDVRVPLGSFAAFAPAGSDGGFSGSLLVSVDDRRTVCRADPERGRDERRLDFRWSARVPELSLALAEDATGRGRPLPANGVLRTAARRVRLEVTRQNDVPAVLRLDCTSADGRELARETWTAVDDAARSREVLLELDEEGAVEIALRARRAGTEPDAGQAGEPVLRAWVVADRTAPALDLGAATRAFRVTDAAAPAPSVALRVADAGPRRPGGSSAPAAGSVRVEHELRDPLGRTVSRETLTLEQAGPLELVAGLPWADGEAPAAGLDGAYAWTAAAVDEAGNRGEPVELAVVVSLEGPALELVRPGFGTPWTRSASGGFELTVSARDPNGVAEVRGLLRPAGAPGDGPDATRFARFEPDPAVQGLFTASLALDESWSGREVEVVLEARDAAGTSGRAVEPRTLGRFERWLPETVDILRPGRPAGRLRLVRGNAGAAYVFGGRLDEEEEEAFESAGLGRYNTRAGSRSWRVRYEPGEIGDFYLDEREVTIAAFLAFARDPAGYADPRCWSAGGRPDGERLAELVRTLEADAPDLPVVGVTWFEADAFARWAGKRLPSLVEWELAVRGGARYRPRSAVSTPGTAPARRRTSEAGGDVTPGTGLRDLCGNVAEWTSTPVTFRPDGRVPRDPAAHAREHRAAMLDPSLADVPADVACWTAGAAFDSPRSDFSVVERRARDAAGPRVGFRCAASADAVHAALTADADGGATGTPLEERR